MGNRQCKVWFNLCAKSCADGCDESDDCDDCYSNGHPPHVAFVPGQSHERESLCIVRLKPHADTQSRLKPTSDHRH
jgi:hypothetical protein